MLVPEFWRGPNGKLYRIRRSQQPLEEAPGYAFTVRAYAVGKSDQPAAEASVPLRDADLREMVRLNQQVPTPEQLYVEAFQNVTSQLSRAS